MTTAAGSMAGGLGAGFHDPVHDAQGVFRDILRAMSRPGEVRETAVQIDPPAPLGVAAAAVCLALLDFETPLWIDGGDTDAAAAFLAFHTGASRAAGPAQADFVLIADGATLPGLDAFRPGTDEAPEGSATVIVQAADLAAASPDAAGAWRLSGPGIDGAAGLRVTGLPDGIVEQFSRNADCFPRGVDLILCAGRRLAALPRTTRVEG